MWQTFNLHTFNAYERLLRLPDPPDLPRRAHVHRCDGDPLRRLTRLPRLLTAWLQFHYLEVDLEDLPSLSAQLAAPTLDVPKGHDAHTAARLFPRARARFAALRRLLGDLNHPVALDLRHK